MKISTQAFEEGAAIPAKFTCDGEDVSPTIEIHDTPAGAVSLAIIVEDPDVPKNLKPDGLWEHWLMWNLPPETAAIGEGEQPEGIIGNNTGGKVGYMGPCPPDREHRYYFSVYALDAMLDIPQTASKSDLDAAMEGHILDKATLMGTYNRPENQK